VKSLSIRQLRDLKRGQKWLSLHFGWSGESHYFSTKAIIVLGRISPAARKAAVEGLDFSAYQGGEILPEGRYRSPKIRIRDLNWGAVKALQTMTSTEVCSRYLRGRYAWTYLHGVQAPKGLEKVSPVGWSKDGSGVWSARTVTFRDFSIWAPEGYSFGVDANGVKLFEVASPEED
jgi:hypothetical protein